MSEKLPQVIEDLVKVSEPYLDSECLQEIRNLSRNEVLDLLSVSIDSTSEEVIFWKSRFFTASLFLGKIRSESKRSAEAEHLKDAHREYLLNAKKLALLRDIYQRALEGRKREPHKREKKGEVVHLFPGGDDVS